VRASGMCARVRTPFIDMPVDWHLLTCIVWPLRRGTETKRCECVYVCVCMCVCVCARTRCLSVCDVWTSRSLHAKGLCCFIKRLRVQKQAYSGH